ncbi:hypothetical protein ACVWWN_005064 [Mycobacterium sp. URHB0021]
MSRNVPATLLMFRPCWPRTIRRRGLPDLDSQVRLGSVPFRPQTSFRPQTCRRCRSPIQSAFAPPLPRIGERLPASENHCATLYFRSVCARQNSFSIMWAVRCHRFHDRCDTRLRAGETGSGKGAGRMVAQTIGTARPRTAHTPRSWSAATACVGHVRHRTQFSVAMTRNAAIDAPSPRSRGQMDTDALPRRGPRFRLRRLDL